MDGVGEQKCFSAEEYGASDSSLKALGRKWAER